MKITTEEIREKPIMLRDVPVGHIAEIALSIPSYILRINDEQWCWLDNHNNRSLHPNSAFCHRITRVFTSIHLS